MLYPFLRAFLFLLPPERAHALVLHWLDIQSLFFTYHQPEHPVRVMGIDFPSRVGLAAGFDKNGDHIKALASLGFGFLEIGTVTPKPQAGQALPRVFRFPKDEALINRMGFPNKGVDYLLERLAQLKVRPVLGINIGKNAVTSLENAVHDYLYCFKRVYPFADYVTVNLSSPNTPGLRELQGGQYLPELLLALKHEQKRLAEENGRHVPLAVKLSPELTDEEIKSIAQVLLQTKIEGVIATNTTTGRAGLNAFTQQAGGLSGAPLFNPSTSILKRLKQELGESVSIIGVGGIMRPEDAQTKFDAGAELIQLYTGLIYKGPSLIKAAQKREFLS